MKRDLGDLVEWRPEFEGEDRKEFDFTREVGAARISALRTLRERLGLSQADVAKILSMTQPNVSKLERRKEIDANIIARLVNAKGGTVRLIADLGEELVEFPL